ncbi:CGNR zinc finger domain-containing protein [Streptomyces sp. NPDC006173]|uniref:CGNR zinc finger domain-containing protein n=1 Tax=Streptomyces sp. NPDC006173 TaxID=3155349 RepID=UPI0033ECA8EF
MDDHGPLIGEPLALDLINTRPIDPSGRADLIATPRRLAAWLALQDDRMPTAARGLTPGPADLAALHAVRAAAEAVVRALLDDDEPPRSALRELTIAQRAAPSVRELAWDGSAVTAEPCRAGPPEAILAAVFAEAVTDLLTGSGLEKVRECEAADCVMLFRPAHPRRRWCSPTRCGNRARVARYYQRHKPPVG